MSAKLITEPGCYDLSEEVYHADPCATPSASSSFLKVLLNESPRHAWEAHPRLNPRWLENQEKKKAESKFDRGHAAHQLMLGGEQRIRVLPYDDYKGGDAKKARAQCYLDDVVPILRSKWPDVEAMACAGIAQLAAHETDSDIFKDGKSEQTLIWVEEIAGIGIMCRAKLDYRKNAGLKYGDYKSLEACINPEVLDRYAMGAGWAFQEAFYRRGIYRVFGEEDPDFAFVVQEASAPFALVTVESGPQKVGVAMRQVEWCLNLMARCVKENSWPGYPNQRVRLGDRPWDFGEFTARESREQAEREAGVDMFKKMIAWQAPL